MASYGGQAHGLLLATAFAAFAVERTATSAGWEITTEINLINNLNIMEKNQITGSSILPTFTPEDDTISFFSICRT